MFSDNRRNMLDKLHANELHWSYFLSLIFSLFYFVPVVLGQLNLYEVLVASMAYCAFVALYVMCYVHADKAHWHITGIVVLAIGLAKINSASYAFIWFAVYFVAYLYPASRAIAIAFAMLASMMLTAHLNGYPLLLYMLLTSLPSVGLLFYGMFDRRLRKEEQEKNERNKQIEQLAVIAERERLARDMHDVLGHSLTAISLKAQLAAKAGKNGELDRALHEIDEVAALASDALTDVREAISQYHRKGFASHLDTLAKQLEAAGFVVNARIATQGFSAKQESQLILLLSEAVTNILRHSNGDHVDIGLDKRGQEYQLSIRDNGMSGDIVSGNGLRGMRDRVSEMNGRFQITRNNGFGLEIQWS